MIRLILIFGLILLAVLGTVWFTDHSGAVTIHWLDYRIDTSFFALAALLTLLTLAGYFLHVLWNWLVRGVPLWGPERELRRQRLGFTALNKAVVALAAGDRQKAQKLTDEALRLLPPQAFTHVIAAQVATLAGDQNAADQHFKALMADPDAALLGVRGLLIQAESQGKTREALALAEKAAALAPDSLWAMESLYRLKIRCQDWPGALDGLVRLEKSGGVDKARVKSDRAVLNYTMAVEADLSGDADKALTLSQKALKDRPDFVPAAIFNAHLHMSAGDKRKAARALKKAWQHGPHPDLVTALLTQDKMARPTEQLRRIKTLTADNPDHPESLIALAGAELAAEHFQGARTLLEKALEGEPDVRVYDLLILLEQAEGGDAVEAKLQNWQDQAKSAIAAPVWKCENCDSIQEDWQAICPDCQSFNSIHWTANRPEILVGESSGQAPEDPLVLLPDPLAK